MRTLLAFLMVALLSACATVDTGGGPKSTEGVATLTGQMDRHGGAFTWRSFTPLSVDSRAVSHSFWTDPRDTVVHVEPGVRRLTVRAAFNSGLGGGGPWESFIVLETKVEAHKAYRINGEVKDNQMIIWLEDTKTGARLAETGNGYFATMAPSPTTIPIFIPTRK